MTLIKEVRKLRELEQRIPELTQDGVFVLYPDGDEACKCRSDLGGTSDDWIAGSDLAEYIVRSHKLAKAAREVLGCIQEGDASGIRSLIAWLDEMQKNSDFVISPEIMQVLTRLQKAVALMERKE